MSTVPQLGHRDPFHRDAVGWREPRSRVALRRLSCAGAIALAGWGAPACHARPAADPSATPALADATEARSGAPSETTPHDTGAPSPADPAPHPAAARCVPKPLGRITPPVLLQKSPIVLTPEASADGVKGPLEARCMLLEDGHLTRCQLNPPLPSMVGAMSWAIGGWRYEPALENGEPTAIEVRVSFDVSQPGSDELQAMREAAQKRLAEHRAMPFGAGMTRPVRLGGRLPQLTAKARDACVSGMLFAKCVIQTDGTLHACRVIAGLPFMNAEVVDALATWRYTPVMYLGKPQAVEFVIPLRFVMVTRD